MENYRINFGYGITPYVKYLLIANVVVFFLQTIDATLHHNFLIFFGSIIPLLITEKYQIWRFFTYMFLHGGFLHIFFNMFMLWMFGPEVERILGGRRFLKFYLFTGIGAGICCYLISPFSPIPVLGASGAIFGVLLAFSMFFPERILLLFMIIPVKAKYVIAGFALLEVYLTLVGPKDSISHIGHVGGLIFGYIFLRWGNIRRDFKFYYLKLKYWWINRKYN